MARPVIVVTTGRSGSTLVSNLVREHPDILSMSEFFVLLRDAAFQEGTLTGPQFWELLSTPAPELGLILSSGITFEEFLYRPGPGRRYTYEEGVPPILLTPLPHLVDDPEALYDELAAWVPTLDERPVAGQYRRLFEWLAQRLGRRVWVERSGVSLAMIPALAAYFPDAGFVHVHRDGRECAMSMSKHGGFKLMALYRRPDLFPPDLVLGGRLNGQVLNALEVPPWLSGESWSEMIAQGVEALAALPPERVTSLGYEDLVADPHAELTRLAEFIGVPAEPSWLERASALIEDRPPRWTRLPDDERARLEEACAPGMALLGRSSRSAAG